MEFAATFKKAKQGDLSFVIRGGVLEVEQLSRDSTTAKELLLGFCARLGVDRIIDGAGELVLRGCVWIVVVLQLQLGEVTQGTSTVEARSPAHPLGATEKSLLRSALQEKSARRKNRKGHKIGRCVLKPILMVSLWVVTTRKSCLQQPFVSET